MKLKFLALAAVVALAAPVALADAKWSCSYNEKTDIYTLTSTTAGDGGTPSVYSVKAGVLSRETRGSETVLDFRESAMPEGAPTIVATGKSIWYNKGSEKEIYLPDSLRNIPNALADNNSSLVHVEPFLPEGVTNVAAQAFAYGTAITNDFRVGFAKDADGSFLTTTIGSNPLKKTKVQSVVLGPGVRKVPTGMLSDLSSLRYVEFGENVAEVGSCTANAAASTLTNIVIKTKGTFPFPVEESMFKNCTKVTEVTWGGWFEHPGMQNPFSGWTALQCRFIVPGDSLQWAAFCADAAKMTPWADCDDADKTAYFTKFGTDAKTPEGISVANVQSFPRTFIVKDEKTLQGAVVVVAEPDAAFGSLEVTVPSYDDGTYESGSTVTVTWTPVEGVEFTGWDGDVAEADRMSTSVKVTATGAKSLTPTFKSSFWVYEDGELKDGEWTLVASGAADAITVGRPKSYATFDGTLDLRKPVKGGAIVAIADNAFNQYQIGKCVKEFLLPDTLESIGDTAFRTWTDTQVRRSRIWPLVPTNVTFIAANAFYPEGYMTGTIEVGFATNSAGESVETVLGSGGQQFWSCTKIGPTVKIGPGVFSIPQSAFRSVAQDYAGAADVWIGANVTNAAAAAFYNFHASKTTTFHVACDMFPGSSAMFYSGENTTSASGTVRVIVEGEKSKKWAAYAADASCVTPWASLTDEQRQSYWTNFPAETFGKKHPTGLTTAAQGTSGLPPNQWLFITSSVGLVLIVR